MDWRIVYISAVDEDGLQNVAKEVSFAVTKTANSETAERSGRIALAAPNDNFIQYQSLTEDTVISWVKQSLGDEFIAKLEASIDDELAIKKPNQVNLPWN